LKQFAVGGFILKVFTTGPHVNWLPIRVFPQDLWRQVARGAGETWRSDMEGRNVEWEGGVGDSVTRMLLDQLKV